MTSSIVLLQGLLITAASAEGFPFFQKVPIEYISPRENPHPDCPKETHILGHGIASSSEKARKGARADVVRQIRSSISALIQRVSTAEQAGKHNSSSTTLTHTITEESDFSYAERIFDIGKTYKKKKNYYALACLERNETAFHIHEQIKERINRFESVLETNHQIFEQKDRIGFTTNYSKAIELYEALESDLLLIRTLNEIPAVMSIITKHNRFLKEADALSSSLRLGISSNHPPSQSELVSIIQQKNLTTFTTSNQCAEDQTHNASITVMPECKKKMGNYFCSLEISYSIQDCIHKKVFTQEWPNSIVGADSRSQEKALERAYKQIEIKNYSKKIIESLQMFTPFLQE